jgi:hypothetical protein
MRIKHYLLIILTLILIAFFQPLVIFLGNLLVIVAAGAYIYSDMTPEAQDTYERKLADALGHVRRSLRGREAEVHQLPARRGSRLGRMFGRSAPVEAEPAVRHSNERQ